jgi:hypothetical protein
VCQGCRAYRFLRVQKWRADDDYKVSCVREYNCPDWERLPPSQVQAPRQQEKRQPAKAARDSKMEARDKWLYQQVRKGKEKPLDQIVAELKRIAPQRKWRIIATVQGIRNAAIKYAERHGLPPPQPRQNL